MNIDEHLSWVASEELLLGAPYPIKRKRVGLIYTSNYLPVFGKKPYHLVVLLLPYKKPLSTACPAIVLLALIASREVFGYCQFSVNRAKTFKTPPEFTEFVSNTRRGYI